MKLKVVYLSGKIDGLSYNEATEIRNDIKLKLNSLGIKCLDPMRGKEYLKDGLINKDTIREDMQFIISRDLSDIDESDGIILTTGDTPSWGTGIEFGYMIGKYGYIKPIFVVSNNKERHGWLRFLATYIGSVDEIIEHIKQYWI